VFFYAVPNISSLSRV